MYLDIEDKLKYMAYPTKFSHV